MTLKGAGSPIPGSVDRLRLVRPVPRTFEIRGAKSRDRDANAGCEAVVV